MNLCMHNGIFDHKQEFDNSLILFYSNSPSDGINEEDHDETKTRDLDIL